MTIAISWIRKVGIHEEMIFASDSRLRSFGSWDVSPKIFGFDRTDCAMTFAGDTQYSFPLINQIQNYVNSYSKAKTRFQDLTHFKGHLLNMMNHMLKFKSDFEVPDVRFLFGGFSWDKNKFFLWNIYFDKGSNQFVSAKVKTWNGIKNRRIVSFIGDYHHEYRQRLIDLMMSRKKFVRGFFDMEPLEVLIKMLKEKKFNDIGGPPQIMKIYKHMNRTPIAIKWYQLKNEYVTLLGRPLEEYEITNYPILDSKKLTIEGGKFNV